MNQYLTVFSTAATSTNLSITVQSFNGATITYSVTGVNPNLSPQELAQTISTQLSTYLIQIGMSYEGFPTLGTEAVQNKFRLTQTAHIIDFWSQERFSVSVSNNSGAIISIGNSPGFSTICNFKESAEINGVELINLEGEEFTEEQIANIILQNSAEIAALLRNNIVLSTYHIALRGKDTKSILTKLKAVYTADLPPRVKRKYWDDIFYPVGEAPGDYAVYPGGEINFIPSENIVDLNEPFALDNEVHVTLRAGLSYIPIEIVKALTLLSGKSIVGMSSDDVEELAGGSFRVKYGSKGLKDDYWKIFAPIKRYRNNARFTQ